MVLGSSQAERGQLIPLHAWAPLSLPGKAPPPLAAGYSRATFHLQGADVVEATFHDVWTGRSELHPLALEVFLVVHGDLERRASCRVGKLPSSGPRQFSASWRRTEGGSVRGRASGGCSGHPLGRDTAPHASASLHCRPRHALPWCRGSRRLGPAPLSGSPLRRSVPGAALPSGERSGAVLGRAGGRAVAGGSPGLCSERSRAKRINGGKGEGHLPGGLRLMLCSPATAPGFDGMLLTGARDAPHLCTGCSSLVHVFLLSLSAPSSTSAPGAIARPLEAAPHLAPQYPLSAWTGEGELQPVAFGDSATACHGVAGKSRAQLAQGAVKSLMKNTREVFEQAEDRGACFLCSSLPFCPLSSFPGPRGWALPFSLFPTFTHKCETQGL